jgi:putative ABC transport system ATP-binding protein
MPFRLGLGGGSVFDRHQILPSLELLGQDVTFLEKSNDDLSGGEAQIVALLRAMQLKPSLLLLDEPTAALDAVATRAIETLVSRWLNDAKTLRATVWVTHDPEQRARVADRILWLEQGRLKENADV